MADSDHQPQIPQTAAKWLPPPNLRPSSAAIEHHSEIDKGRQQSNIFESPTVYNPTLEIRRRLQEIGNLRAGWASGLQHPPIRNDDYGTLLTRSRLVWLANQFEGHYAFDLPIPSLFLNPDGALLAEWTSNGYAAILEIDLEGADADWLRFALNNDDEDQDRHLNLDSKNDWAWLNQAVRVYDQKST